MSSQSEVIETTVGDVAAELVRRASTRMIASRSRSSATKRSRAAARRGPGSSPLV